MITLDELRQAVAFVIDRAEADHGPDFRYHPEGGSCEYRTTLRNPYGCVVGAALTELGWPVPADLNDKGIREVVNAGAVSMTAARSSSLSGGLFPTVAAFATSGL
jgi:hypothetical protein